MWALVLSGLTIAAKGLTDLLTEKGREEQVGSRQLSSLIMHHLPGRLHISDFVAGTLMGMGISWLFAALSQQFQIGQRCKLFFRYWVCSYGNSKADQTSLHHPANAFSIEHGIVVQNNAHGSIRHVLSPINSSSFSLVVSILSIAPGREIAPSRAPASEFYYVVSGAGRVSQQGIAKTSNIRAGDYFAVDVGRMRWISNLDSILEDLVLIRATDRGSNCAWSGTNYFATSSNKDDMIVRDPNRAVNGGGRSTTNSSGNAEPSSTSTTIESLKDSMRHVHRQAKYYYANGRKPTA